MASDPCRPWRLSRVRIDQAASRDFLLYKFKKELLLSFRIEGAELSEADCNKIISRLKNLICSAQENSRY